MRLVFWGLVFGHLCVGCDESSPSMLVPEPQSQDSGAVRADRGETDVTVPNLDVRDAFLPDASDAHSSDVSSLESDMQLSHGQEVVHLAVGHRFSAEIGVRGTGVSIFTLEEDGAIARDIHRFNLPHEVEAIDFINERAMLVVASEDGMISAVALSAMASEVTSQVTIDASGVTSIVRGTGSNFAALNRDSNDRGGVYWFDETLEVQHFMTMPLVYAVSQCPGRERWVVVGGQTLFEPIRLMDIHIVDMSSEGPEIVAQADLIEGIFDLRSVAVTKNCQYAMFADQQPFSDTFGRLFLVDLTAEAPELLDYVDTEQDIANIEYVSELDLFLMYSFESETLMTFKVIDQRLTEVDRLSGMGLISGAVVVSTPEGRRVYVTSIHSTHGSRIGWLSLGDDGDFGPVGWRFLGEGGENMPSMLRASANRLEIEP